jgi:hypothetical protein
VGHEKGQSKDFNPEIETFLSSCQDRGVAIVPSDDIVAWLQSLPRTEPGDSPIALDPSLLVVTSDGVIESFGSNPYRKLRSVI